MFDPEMAAKLLDSMKRMRAAGRSITGEIHFDAKSQDYMMTVVPLGTDMVITTGTDITALKDMETELKLRAMELSQFEHRSSAVRLRGRS